MEAKTGSTRVAAEPTRKDASLGSFTRRLGQLQEIKAEMRKISWTSKTELLFCTKIVVGATFCFGIGIYLVDLSIKGCLDGVNAAVRLLFG